jgi:hypothetical protein
VILRFCGYGRGIVGLEFAEMAGEVDLLLIGEWLVTEYQHSVVVHTRFDRGDICG